MVTNILNFVLAFQYMPDKYSNSHLALWQWDIMKTMKVTMGQLMIIFNISDELNLTRRVDVFSVWSASDPSFVTLRVLMISEK